MLSAKRWPRTGPAASLEEARRTQASACLWSRPPNGLEMAPDLLPRRRPCGSNSKKGLQTRHQLRSRLSEQCVLMADRLCGAQAFNCQLVVGSTSRESSVQRILQGVTDCMADYSQGTWSGRQLCSGRRVHGAIMVLLDLRSANCDRHPGNVQLLNKESRTSSASSTMAPVCHRGGAWLSWFSAVRAGHKSRRRPSQHAKSIVSLPTSTWRPWSVRSGSFS